MSTTRILLADDHMLMRMGLSTLFIAAKDMEIVGEATDGRQAVQLADKLKPDVVLMDLMMPEMNGAEATKAIHEAHPEIKIVILTTFGTAVELVEAVKNGAVATLMKDTAAKELVKAIRSVVAGNKIIPTRLLNQIEEDNEMSKLTDRQLEILAGAARGYTNADIAKQIGLSEISIKKQMTTIYESLGVSNRTEAVALALRKQMIKA